MEKTGRNDPCVCGSGKKFKKCCESKMIGKKFMATKIEPSFFQNTSSISSFFQKKVTPLTVTAIPQESIKISAEEENNEEVVQDRLAPIQVDVGALDRANS